jgi:hypothetical protein
MTTDTPRTNAATFDIQIIGDARTQRRNDPDGYGDFVDADFARTLERENTALRAEVEKAWREGYEDRTSFRQLESDDWNRSRAKQVAEGKIPLDVAK